MALPDHESFPQPPDPSILAWRYIDTPKLLSLLLQRALHLGRVDLLPDKFEGTQTKPTRDLVVRALTAPAPRGGGMHPDQALKLADQIEKSSDVARRTCYASCWSLRNHESEAMWRLYCGLKDGVALVLPYARLRGSLHDDPERTYIGTVTYLDYETSPIPGQNIFNLVMHKRREFEYEHEARVISWRLPESFNVSKLDALPAAITLPWQPEEYIERIVVTPYADPWYLHTIKDLVRLAAPRLVDRVLPSSMG